MKLSFWEGLGGTGYKIGCIVSWFYMSLYLPPANEVCEGYVFTGVCLSTGWRGHAWHACPPQQTLWDALNERAVCILLECILVRQYFHTFCSGGRGEGRSPCDRYPWCIGCYCIEPLQPVRPLQDRVNTINFIKSPILSWIFSISSHKRSQGNITTDYALRDC